MTEVEHPGDAVFQAFLEEELDDRDRAEVQAHIAACSSCAAQLEGWRSLFQELAELPVLEPSGRLRARVLAESAPQARPARGPWGRIREAVATASQAGLRHLRPRAIEDLLDAVAGQEGYARVRAHASACSACDEELGRWEHLYGALGTLGRLEPPPGFADRVMQRVEVGVPVARAARERTFSWARLKAAARSLLPSSRAGWTLAAAFGAAPALAIVVGFILVQIHPLLTVGSLFTFVEWHVSDFVRLGSAWMIQWIGDGSLAIIETPLAQTLLASPGLALAGLLALWSALSAAGWVLYRHVIAPILLTSRHVQASS